MATQLETNTSTLQSVLETVNSLPSSSVTSVNGITGEVVLTPDGIGAAASSHNQAASTITTGTFAGTVVAQRNSQTYSSYLLRNSKLTTSATNPSYNGEICWTYE